jgi:hypothetical protein
MFARQKTDGWDVFGNMVDSDVDIEAEEQPIEERLPDKAPTIIDVTEGDGLFGEASVRKS